LLTSPGNGIIADKLREMADILELQHEDGFRVGAYRRAARTLALERPVDEIGRSEGTNNPGLQGQA
jgi:DNA polymerase/3'-5' exonuclease PolX